MNLKKRLIPNIPYVVIGLFATNLGEGWRLAAGSNASEKLLHIVDGLSAAFANPLPSFHLADICVGAAVGGFLRLAVYLKGKNAKKYRKNMEYGSARWRQVIYALSDFLIMILSWLVKQSLRAFLFQEVQP